MYNNAAQNHKSLLVVPLRNKFSEYKLMTICYLLVIVLAVCLLVVSKNARLMPMTLFVLWVLIEFVACVFYMFSNSIMSIHARKLNAVVEFSSLYFLLKNAIPLIAVTVWAALSKQTHVSSSTEIILTMFVLGFVFYALFIYLKKSV